VKEAWEKWGWIAALCACALFTLRMLWGRQAFCGSGEEQCLREWFSATGGWIALGIGILSLKGLREQVTAAVQANENNAKIQLRRNYTLAKRVESIADFILMNSISLADEVRKGAIAATINPGQSAVIARIDLIIDMLQQGGFDKFEEEIEFPTPYTAEFIRRRAAYLKRSIEPIGDVALAIGLRSEIFQFSDWCKFYAESCMAAAKSFIDEADQMRGNSHARASRLDMS